MVDKITHNGKLIAIIIPSTFRKDGLEFFTPPNLSQQLAYMRHTAGHKIRAHVHNLQVREVNYTLETLFIRTGSLRVDFFDNEKNYLESRTLSTGDVLLQASGGHGFTFLEPTDIIEVKQGPYVEGADKICFEPADVPDDPGQ